MCCDIADDDAVDDDNADDDDDSEMQVLLRCRYRNVPHFAVGLSLLMTS